MLSIKKIKIAFIYMVAATFVLAIVNSFDSTLSSKKDPEEPSEVRVSEDSTLSDQDRLSGPSPLAKRDSLKTNQKPIKPSLKELKEVPIPKKSPTHSPRREAGAQAGNENGPVYATFPVQDGTNADIISDWDDPRGDVLHEAIDIKAPRGTPALAVENGVIHRVTEHPQAGLYVVLHDTLRNLFLYYAHLDEQLVEEGQAVAAGEVLGLVGDTGNAKGTLPHLHFAIRLPDRSKIDPMPFVRRLEEE